MLVTAQVLVTPAVSSPEDLLHPRVDATGWIGDLEAWPWTPAVAAFASWTYVLMATVGTLGGGHHAARFEVAGRRHRRGPRDHLAGPRSRLCCRPPGVTSRSPPTSMAGQPPAYSFSEEWMGGNRRCKRGRPCSRTRCGLPSDVTCCSSRGGATGQRTGGTSHGRVGQVLARWFVPSPVSGPHAGHARGTTPWRHPRPTSPLGLAAKPWPFGCTRGARLRAPDSSVATSPEPDLAIWNRAGQVRGARNRWPAHCVLTRRFQRGRDSDLSGPADPLHR